ncbi:short-chain dehydrogenase/reductase SDR [Mycolicibacterium mageritense DSM 44476 = CIP 104973]|uniref:Short-chain dehydrogenase/reductase n=2 Tax=Mycobacteriaceae TaxID=1762 RepID=A0ABN5Y6X2_MYCME|nr:short-chain dehydrogenase/reductase [Mycolicibacterium mageritense]CDO21830.1 putative short chain oxidoreductase protein [Mycolicibacterium mageritense DSM 44476 = CIP 104973]
MIITMHVTYAWSGATLVVMSAEVVLITGASSGFGRLTAEALARAGHVVYASMRDAGGRNAATAAGFAELSQRENIELRALDLDVQSEQSVSDAVARVVADNGRLDVVVHNAGHMVFGPAEAFTPEQYASLFDVNVIGTQRVNRAALPHLRHQGRGLLVWVSSSSSAGGTPPYLAPYFAVKAAMDSLAVSYARELSRWGIETSIIVPGAFTAGTNHFAHAGAPADQAVAAEYQSGPYRDFGAEVQTAFNAIVPADADVSDVARAIVRVVDTPFGRRPFRVHIDPSGDGADVGFAVLDRLRAEMLHRVGLADLLSPTTASR